VFYKTGVAFAMDVSAKRREMRKNPADFRAQLHFSA
jgi:hypothetical protein